MEIENKDARSMANSYGIHQKTDRRSARTESY